MKKINLLFSVILAGILALAGCQRETIESASRVIKFSSSNIELEGEDVEQQTLKVYADGNWTITSEIPSWLSIYPTSAFGYAELTIDAAENVREGALDKIRTATIVFEGNNRTKSTVIIKQLGDKFRDCPYSEDVETVTSSEDGTIFILPGVTVMATAQETAVVSDGADNLLVRIPAVAKAAEDALKVGDVVELRSDKQSENLLPVVTVKHNEGDTIKVTGTATYEYPEVESSDIDAVAGTESVFLSFNGLFGADGAVTIGTVEEVEGGGKRFVPTEARHRLAIVPSSVFKADELKNHEVAVKGYFAGQTASTLTLVATSVEDKGFVGKKLEKVLYYDDFNVQKNNTPDLCDGYTWDMKGAGVGTKDSGTTYTAGRLVDFRNTYKQSKDGGAYKDYENELYPGHSGMQGGSLHAHLYPCVTPGTGQSSAEDAWFQINEIKVFNSTAIQLGFGAFGVDGPSQVDYTFKYKFDNQSEWTVYKAFRIQQDWQWVSLDQIAVPAGAKSVSFRGEAVDKNYIRLDDLTLVGDDDGGFVEPVLELVTESPVEIDATEQDVTVQFKTNLEFTHNLADFSEWITLKGLEKEGEMVTVTLGVAANAGNDREAAIVVKNEAKAKEITLTLKQQGGAQKYLELVGKAITDDAFSVGREGADIVAKYKTNVTPSVEGLPTWATIKDQKTSNDTTTVTITVAPNTTAKVRNAVVRVYNADVENDILYYIAQDCTLPTGADVLFAENFDWMKDYYKEYADANSDKTFGDSVGKRDKDANSPNFYSAAGLDGLRKAFAAKGYGDSNASKKVIYPNDAYLKFGKTNTGTRLVLPALTVEGTVDATITFNYAFQVQGTGKVDETELFVFVDGQKVNAEKLPTTQVGGDVNVDPRVVRDFTWQTATLELKGISKDSKIEIGNETLTITQRFFLDNIVIKKTGGAPDPETIEWGFNATEMKKYADNFGGTAGVASKAAGNGGMYVQSTVSGNGKIEYYQIDKTELDKDGKATRIVGSTGQPYVTGTWTGDYWLTSADLENTHPAGTKVKFHALSRCSGTGMRYWLIEYKDGNEWKPLLATKTEEIETKETITYNIKHENTTEFPIDVTVTLANPTKRVEFRQTCVANAQASGKGALAAPNGGTHRYQGALAADGSTNTSTKIIVGVSE